MPLAEERTMKRVGCRSGGGASIFRRGPRTGRPIARVGFLALLAWGACGVGHAQVIMRGIPSDEHFATFNPYLNGDYVTAGRAFASTPRIKSTEGVWIDSIPYHTM